MADPTGEGDDEAPTDPGPERDDGDARGAGVTTGGSTDDTVSVVEQIGDSDLEELLGERRRLHERVRYLWILGRIVPALVLGGVVGFGAAWLGQVGDDLAVGLGVAVFGLFMVYSILRALLLYRSWRYVVREDSLYLTRGVFTIVQTVVPYVRVQHIDTRRSALERVLGLSSLVVYTAGSRGADVTIPGLTPDRAENLQSRLERLAIESEEEDAV